MNERQEKIISFLDQKKDWVKGKDIALVMHVTTRTIRSDIETINNQMEDGWIESSYQMGYRLHIEKKALTQTHTNGIPQTPKERCDYILKKLLSVRESHISELCEQVCASIYTVEQDLKTIRTRMLPDDGLDLIYKKGWVSLVGDEYEKRRLFKRLLMEEVEENFFNIDCIAKLYPEFDLYRCKDLMSSCMKAHGFSVREMEVPMILMHVGVALKRMMLFHTIEETNDDSEIEKTVEYAVANDLYDRIAKLYPLKVNKNEKRQLALLLMGKKALEFTDNTIDYNGKKFELDQLTLDMLQSIYLHFCVNMKEDEELLRGLSLHLKSLVGRMNNNTSITNVYLDEIRWKFPLIFDMAVCAGETLKQTTGINISQDEIGFLALHLGASYNKITMTKRYRCLLFFPNDQALSSLVIDKIRNQFEERINIIGIEKTFEEKKVKDMNPDLILTTIPLTHSLNIPTVNISIFYSPENEAEIFSCLNKMDKEKRKKDFVNGIKNLIKKEYFYDHFPAKSAEEALRKMIDPLVTDGLVPSNYYNSILEREKFAPTSFQVGFALPHALNCDVNESVISIAFLDQPIKWGEYTVEFVILLGIKQSDNALLGVFFDWWIQLVSDPIRFTRLKRQKNYESFMHAILEE